MCIHQKLYCFLDLKYFHEKFFPWCEQAGGISRGVNYLGRIVEWGFLLGHTRLSHIRTDSFWHLVWVDLESQVTSPLGWSSKATKRLELAVNYRRGHVDMWSSVLSWILCDLPSILYWVRAPFIYWMYNVFFQSLYFRPLIRLWVGLNGCLRSCRSGMRHH